MSSDEPCSEEGDDLPSDGCVILVLLALFLVAVVLTIALVVRLLT
jgi:hypothetical protein